MRLFSAIVLFLLASTVAHAGDARFGQVVLGVEGDSTARTVFAPDTPAIVLRADITDILVGTRLTATWVAVSAEGAAANYQIASADLEIKQASGQASFTVSRPDKGWPVGDYKVSLSINGQVATSLLFKIAPPGRHFVPATLENGKLVPGHFE
jgi:hypothetical protein